MTPECKPNQSLPQSCATAFSDLGERLASIETKVDATHEETVRTNGHIEELFVRVGRHDTRLAVIDHDIVSVQDSRSRWMDRLWRLGLVLVAAYIVWKQNGG